LYGVISHTVIARRREWAVRLALGSAPRDVVRLVLRRGLRLAAIGIGAGFVLTLVAIRFLPPDVQGLADAPAPILRSVSILLIQVAVLASAVPAFRVGRIAPAAALRYE
jgi:ABC-type antimicrobial peptide transport system permease subunit